MEVIRMTLKQKTNGKKLPVDNVVPITSALSQEVEKLQRQVEQLQSELKQANQKIMSLRILNAQQKKDMEGMQKKYVRIEQENKNLKEEKKILLSSMRVMEAENQQFRRIIFGQSTEKTNTAGHEDSNTTALPEGTTCSTDEDTKETEMAEGSCGDGHNSVDLSGKKHSQPKEQGAGSGEKKLRPNNIRSQMEKSLPTIHWYPLSPELIRKLDEMYGKGQWRIMKWEGAQHLVHIPEMYVNRVDFVPILCLKDGTPVRPFTEHPEEFPTSILPHSVLSSSEFANIVHRKFALGIPLYRQEKDLLQMCGIHLGRQDMADWIIRAGTQGFIQVYDYLIRQERACEYHSIDETFLQVILDGRSAATKSYLWAHRTGELANPEHPVVVFIFEPTRATEHLRKYFPEDIAAVISCDHYIAYETLESERKNILIALCWMHVRRRFFYAFDLIANIKGLAEETIRESLEAKLLMLIGKIYREEMKLKDLEPAKRKEERNLKVRPVVEEFFDILHSLDPDDPSLSHLLQDAVKYTLDAEEKLKRFLNDPTIPIDNGSAERIIRKVATGRRAWLFCDTPDGAKALALFYSLVATAQLNNANDYYYIKYLCEHVPGGLLGPIRQLSDKELEVLMPWSEEYRSYEKHEIESRYDAVTIGNDMKKPTKDDILEMRRQMESAATSVNTGKTANNEMQLDGSFEQPGIVPDLPDTNVSNMPDAQQTVSEAVSSQIYENVLVEIPGTMPDDGPIDGEQDTRDGPIVRKNDMLPVIQDEKIRRRTG
jgi:hypothetical protein